MRTRDRDGVRALNDVGRPARRLVCFPHSGGSAATFRDWPSAVPEDCELLAVQYPGHADRIAEEPADSVAGLAARVAEELLELDPVPCALFGHSLGALVAYETARVLRDRARPVRNLFVSGAPAPGLASGGTTHLRSDDALWSGLRELGGIDPAVADDAELRELLLPVVRADIRLNETYRADPRAEPLDCAVRCYRTTEDPLVDGERLAAWAGTGTGGFSVRTWPGTHFTLVAEPDELIADLVTAFAAEVDVR
ncbi:thioesterase II family protein [Streptomyces californicus]|uniref:thioesterase II family protein n=1 Tax=Streptomyces californicus TaxID=67351 RepID=UPI0037AA3BD4